MDGRVLSIVLICLAGCSAGSAGLPVESDGRNGALTDQALHQAAEQALGDVEGALIVIDPATGRLRAVVNPRLAFEQSFPPGSSIKPFTLLAAWRSGLIDPGMKHRCGTRYEREGFSIVCSHPQSAAPFTIDQALAWSCNDFFARIGERLSEGSFNSLLNEFGFGHRTGIVAAENPGQLKSGEWKVAHALGEGDSLLVTPIQLLATYSALLNGGKLLRPAFVEERGVVGRISLPPGYREQLLKGLRGAVRYGTASKAGLGRLPVIGKTGTATSSNGFRSHGWFVGFQLEANAPKLGVLVFLRRGNGAKAAAAAGKFFECAFGKCGPATAMVAASAISDRSRVMVRSIREGITRELPLEEYLTGVLAGEAGAESQIEALKAQAVISRTFALRNMGRHSAEGYDFCSTTHCQRFVANARNRPAVRAVASTAGLVLADRLGRPIDAYFHAACGGRTADIETLWGVRPSPPYLRGVRDDYCGTMPHRHWTQTIAAESLRRALQLDERASVGTRIDSIRVAQRDASGRAQRLIIEGGRRVEIGGWEFKMIVGRHLGWQMIKSSLFDVSRSGDSFIFRGGGFGHGLGLCQEGARGAARRGLRFNRILDHYFPGTRLIQADLTAYWSPDIDGLGPIVEARYEPPQASTALSSEHFRVRVVRGPLNASPEKALQVLESGLRDLQSRLERAAVHFAIRRPFEVVFHATTADFITATGLSGWSAGATQGNSIQLQPLEILRKRRIFETTLRHELAHAAIEQIGGGRTQRWLAEGLAIHFAGEGATLPDISGLPRLSPAALEDALSSPKPHRQMRVLYAQAYREIRELIRRKGEAAVWKMAAADRKANNDDRRI